jgi:nicotinamidase-related amidase/RimJ/RimL family protein N-acetyltransferase
MLRIRRLHATDITQIKHWPPYPGDMAQMDYALRPGGWLDEFRAGPDTTLYAADDNGELAGFSLLFRTEAEEAEFRIALRPDRTGQGLGALLALRTLAIGFTHLGFTRIHLIVRKNNRRGIGLYRRLGFAARGECHRDIQGRSVDFWLMEISREQFFRQHAGTPTKQKEEHMTPTPRRALIVIDVQNDYVQGKLPIEFPPVELSLANIGRVMDAAKAAAIPVVAVQNILPATAPFMARGTRGAELHQVVTARGWDHFIRKEMPDAFRETGLEAWLRAKKIDTITIVGYMTHNCDLSTVIHGMHAGFAVEFISDATGSLPYANRAGSATAEEIHRVTTVVMQARFAAVMSTKEWLAMVAGNAPAERDTIYASNCRARMAGTGG